MDGARGSGELLDAGCRTERDREAKESCNRLREREQRCSLKRASAMFSCRDQLAEVRAKNTTQPHGRRSIGIALAHGRRVLGAGSPSGTAATHNRASQKTQSSVRERVMKLL